MERRVLLAVTLSFLVLVLYQQWIGPPPAVESVPADPVAGAADGGGVSDAAAALTPLAGAPLTHTPVGLHSIKHAQ